MGNALRKVPLRWGRRRWSLRPPPPPLAVESLRAHCAWAVHLRAQRRSPFSARRTCGASHWRSGGARSRTRTLSAPGQCCA
eukprot:4746766-Alexandrium_andersonii.AAC.1